MSKIAEQKALEIYPDIEINWTMTDRTKERMIYADGYDQAMQDFMEKAEDFLYLQLNNSSIECGNIERLIDDLKNHMQNEEM